MPTKTVEISRSVVSTAQPLTPTSKVVAPAVVELAKSEILTVGNKTTGDAVFPSTVTAQVWSVTSPWKVMVLSDAAKAETADDRPTKTLRAMIFFIHI